MGGWSTHTGQMKHLPLDNVDTDQLIPARFMSAPRSAGYGGFLLYDLRHDDTGAVDPAFPVKPQDGTSILLTGRNFGSGSSREAAVYALVDAGIRAVIGPGFGDIFASNAVNNGLLPATISDTDAALLADLLTEGAITAKIDLDASRLTLQGTSVGFELDDGWKTKLINGWDDIDLTLQHAEEISEYRKRRHQTAPWAWPNAAD